MKEPKMAQVFGLTAPHGYVPLHLNLEVPFSLKTLCSRGQVPTGPCSFAKHVIQTYSSAKISSRLGQIWPPRAPRPFEWWNFWMTFRILKLAAADNDFSQSSRSSRIRDVKGMFWSTGCMDLLDSAIRIKYIYIYIHTIHCICYIYNTYVYIYICMYIFNTQYIYTGTYTSL